MSKCLYYGTVLLLVCSFACKPMSDSSVQENIVTLEYPLVQAICKNNVHYVRKLLEQGINVHVLVKDGVSPYPQTLLFMAVCLARNRKGAAIVELLLKYGASADVIDEGTQQSALYYALSNCKEDLVKILLSYNADPNLKSGYGVKMSPLVVAVRMCASLSVIELLLDRGAYIDEVISETDCTLLSEAIRQDNSELVKLFLKRGADPNYGTLATPLLVAITQKTLSNRRNLVHLLLQSKADVSKREALYGYSPLYVAVAALEYEIAYLLIEYGASINQRTLSGRTPLMVAAQLGSLEFIEYLIDRGAQLNAVDSKGQSALFYALKRRRVDQVKLLLDKGADPNKANYKGITPLMQAALLDDKKNVLLLLKASAIRTLNAKNDDGLTVLLQTVERGQADLTELLLRVGADVQCYDKQGCSVLFKALQTWNQDKKK